MNISKKENKLIKKRCGTCKHALVCFTDYEIGIWNKKELKCDDIRLILDPTFYKKYELKEEDFRPRMSNKNFFSLIFLILTMAILFPFFIIVKKIYLKIRGY